MTKQEFLSGTSFVIPNSFSNSDTSYKYKANSSTDLGYLLAELNHKGKTISSNYAMNVEAIGRKQVKLFTFVLGKKVNRTLKFEDLLVYEDVMEVTSV